MHKAAKNGSEACVSLLLQAGANVNAANERDYTPLDRAVENGSVACIALLLNAGAHTCVLRGLWRVHRPDQAALADESHRDHDRAVAMEKRRIAIVAVLQSEYRWRRRRPLALIREQRRAVRDAGLVHKRWEKEQGEAAGAKGKRKQQKR